MLNERHSVSGMADHECVKVPRQQRCILLGNEVRRLLQKDRLGLGQQRLHPRMHKSNAIPAAADQQRGEAAAATHVGRQLIAPDGALRFTGGNAPGSILKSWEMVSYIAMTWLPIQRAAGAW